MRRQKLGPIAAPYPTNEKEPLGYDIEKVLHGRTMVKRAERDKGVIRGRNVSQTKARIVDIVIFFFNEWG